MNAIHLVIAACGGMLSISLSVQDQRTLRVKLPPLNSSQCPLKAPPNYTDPKEVVSVINRLLTEKYGSPLCTCSKGVFQRAVYLNMSDSSTQCPSNWSFHEGAIRGCGSTTYTSGCSSTMFSTSVPYNHVCGKILGYQKGSPDAFDQVYGATLDIEEYYVDGVSLTYGAPGSRKHIWTFAALERYISYNCECNRNWNQPLPSFMGNNYFCESGNAERRFDRNRIYADDPLWDGQGCASTSTCCGLNRPPWFCATLPQTTTEDLEIRICKDQSTLDEDVIVSLIDIYTSKI